MMDEISLYRQHAAAQRIRHATALARAKSAASPSDRAAQLRFAAGHRRGVAMLYRQIRRLKAD